MSGDVVIKARQSRRYKSAEQIALALRLSRESGDSNTKAKALADAYRWLDHWMAFRHSSRFDIPDEVPTAGKLMIYKDKQYAKQYASHSRFK